VKPGEVVADRYELDEVIGAGGMATVFKARDRVLDRTVAIKLLYEQYAADPEYAERFLREARAIAKLAHPNIVTVIDRGDWNGRPYIVFEYVPGGNLRQVANRRRRRFSVPDAVAVAHDVARALAVAHEHGIIHRDVKPENVLVDERGRAKVTDFGIARAVESERTLTKTGTVIGTSDYMAPEQIRGERVDERCDQYSLGVLLYELLTGSAPFTGESFMAVAMRHLHDPVPSVGAARRGIPPRLDALVRRAMAKRPEERFPSTGDVVAALEAVLAELRGAKPAPPPLAVARAWPAVPPRMLAALAAAAAVAIVAAVVIVIARDPAVPAGGERRAPAEEGRLRLTAIRDHDPFGDGEEHADEVGLATDGNAGTYWTTERYSSFDKPGVGIVLDAGRRAELTGLRVVSDEPGFKAKIRAGNGPRGPFRDVSRARTVGPRTLFRIDATGDSFRYYLIWITDPNGRAHVNEVRATS
jgi:tRNA A-37 threonylcarbamoyl transferase component Bud32